MPNAQVNEDKVASMLMVDGCKIFKDVGGWRVKSMDDLHLLARGKNAEETEWNMDRFTRFGTLEGAIEAWLEAYYEKPGVWKGQ